MQAVEVHTQLNGDDVLVGTLYPVKRRNRLSSTFEYDGDYPQHPGAYALEPRLTLSMQHHNIDGLPCCLQDASPDRWGQMLISRKLRAGATGRKMLNEANYLLEASDITRQGALRLKRPGDSVFASPVGQVPDMSSLQRLYWAASRVASDPRTVDEAVELLEAGAGALGGSRPKACVRDGQTLLVAKFSQAADAGDVLGMQQAALRVAARCGIEVPQTQLVRFQGGGSALLSSRFDREGSRIDGRRVPYVSGLTLIGSDTEEGHDYLELGEAVAADPRRGRDNIQELFGRIALSVAMHSAGDQVKDMGFVRGSSGWTFAPLLAINPDPREQVDRYTPIYGGFGDTEAEALRGWAGYFDLGRSVANRIVSDVLQAVDSWRSEAEQCGVPEQDTDQVSLRIQAATRQLDKAFDL